jgi:hypothetical protein
LILEFDSTIFIWKLAKAHV